TVAIAEESSGQAPALRPARFGSSKERASDDPQSGRAITWQAYCFGRCDPCHRYIVHFLDARLRMTRLRADARGGDGGVREEPAAGVETPFLLLPACSREAWRTNDPPSNPRARSHGCCASLRATTVVAAGRAIRQINR